MPRALQLCRCVTVAVVRGGTILSPFVWGCLPVQSTLGTIALLTWPFVTAVLFSRLDPVRAGIWSILAGYLLLPPVVGIDLPMIPWTGKDAIAALSAFVALLVVGSGSRTPPPWSGWVVAMLILAALSPFLTALANPEALAEGITYRPGLSLYDGLSGAIASIFSVLPFVLGYVLLSTPTALRLWLRALVLAALVYSIPMLVEVRLSPQINVWVYGFFAHDFGQMMRYGGFRPMVFLNHGLWVAIFASAATMAAAVQIRDRGWSSRGALTLLWLAGVLVLCKSAASIIYAFFFVPVILVVPLIWQLRIASALALLVLIYPLSRWWNLLPTDAIIDFIIGIDQDRAYSMDYRFNNEAALLERASIKALVGWGEWNRNHIMDPESGRTLTVADGAWIVQMSVNGLLGFLWKFGLLSGSVLHYAARSGRHGIDAAGAGLALILAVNLVDLIPNATLTPLTWMSAGALAGLAARREFSTAETPATVLRLGRQPIKTII